ncbi:MAG: type II toxin-antitoxin system HicA family toxin [Oscillibacter sp.]|nr:type II toxin-antitoxin system HicA family toxin [Oscillibacter sp.]
MKRRDLIQLLESNGWHLARHGDNHDIWEKGKQREPIPRHREINEKLAQAIIKRQGLK